MLAEEVLARRGGWGAHPNAEGHRLMASAVDALLLEWRRRSHLETRPAALIAASGGGCAPEAASHAEQVCRYGERALSELLVASQGFGVVAPSEEGRTGGLAATQAGAMCELRLASRSLASGYVTIGFERGWRNYAHASVVCMPPCACRAMSINATNPKPYTITAFEASVWTTLGHTAAMRGGGYECVLRARVQSLSAGRLMLQAVTLSAPLPGNRSIAMKDSLEVAHRASLYRAQEGVL